MLFPVRWVRTNNITRAAGNSSFFLREPLGQFEYNGENSLKTGQEMTKIS